jgi:hypothetical protein
MNNSQQSVIAQIAGILTLGIHHQIDGDAWDPPAGTGRVRISCSQNAGEQRSWSECLGDMMRASLPGHMTRHCLSFSLVPSSLRSR